MSSDNVESLKAENEALKQELEYYKNRLGDNQVSRVPFTETDAPTRKEEVREEEEDASLSIVVMGASGDLAKKMTFPSLFNLYTLGLLPPHLKIYGFARSKKSDDEFREHASANFPQGADQAKKEAFLKTLHYESGQYDSVGDLQRLVSVVKKGEDQRRAHRLFYMAIPPTVYGGVSKAMNASSWRSQTGWNRVVFEKPFGMDLESSRKVSTEMAQAFEEQQIFRIDHYLGKEMVLNLLVLRFANTVFEPLWNRNYISNVTITFKEDIGTGGRAGFFDKFGIIRDVMQNHLLQVFSLLAMEPPVSLDARDIRDEKVKVLRACSPIKLEDMVTGQFTADEAGKHQGYKDEEGVPKDSNTPTYAAACIHINNQRWRGVPFIIKCGKALDERKTEVRIQFKTAPSFLFEGVAPNELVLRIQPNEAVYLKFNQKTPGLTGYQITTSELDLTYKERFAARLPGAYERLIFDAIRGESGLFVRVDELEAAWRIFTPILHDIDAGKIKPIDYPFGSRGPKEGDELSKRYGFQRNTNYTWKM